jgi:hydroxymethylpyrimidine/phosphomethylpyrimidine kinase
MLQNESAVSICAKFIEKQELPVVLDPVMWASSGRRLIRPSALPNLNLRLIPLCRLVTPNLLEAQTFHGRPVRTLPEAEEAAQSLSRRWKTWVLLKGGHLPGAPVDILADRDQVRHFPHPRIAPGVNLRGTGCALSAAAAVGLAQGKTVPDAVEFAEDFIQRAIENHYVAAKDPDVGFLGF